MASSLRSVRRRHLPSALPPISRTVSQDSQLRLHTPQLHTLPLPASRPHTPPTNHNLTVSLRFGFAGRRSRRARGGAAAQTGAAGGGGARCRTGAGHGSRRPPRRRHSGAAPTRCRRPLGRFLLLLLRRAWSWLLLRRVGGEQFAGALGRVLARGAEAVVAAGLERLLLRELLCLLLLNLPRHHLPRRGSSPTPRQLHEREMPTQTWR
eukprot:1454736-Rhodomonas_salina.1